MTQLESAQRRLEAAQKRLEDAEREIAERAELYRQACGFLRGQVFGLDLEEIVQQKALAEALGEWLPLANRRLDHLRIDVRAADADIARVNRRIQENRIRLKQLETRADPSDEIAEVKAALAEYGDLPPAA